MLTYYITLPRNEIFPTLVCFEIDEKLNLNYAELNNFMGKIPDKMPDVQVKLNYSNDFLYLYFKVREFAARCVETEINGKVWEDSCVEFFFAPDSKFPEQYFGLEINCGGTSLMRYYTIPRHKYIEISPEHVREIEIIHSLPKIVDPEIVENKNWVIEAKIPFKMLQLYAGFEIPKSQSRWKGNFHKVAVNNSNPHYISWNKIESEKPDFHRPDFFGDLLFI